MSISNPHKTQENAEKVLKGLKYLNCCPGCGNDLPIPDDYALHSPDEAWASYMCEDCGTSWVATLEFTAWEIEEWRWYCDEGEADVTQDDKRDLVAEKLSQAWSEETRAKILIDKLYQLFKED